MDPETLFFDICRGVSEQQIDQKRFYVKHPGQYDFFLLRKSYADALESTQKQGILTEADQVEMVCEQGWWSRDKENRIDYLKNSISRLVVTKKNLIYDSDRKRLDEQLAQHLAEIDDIKQQRKMYINLTAEDVASQQTSIFFVKRFVYENAELTKPCFTDISYEDADDFDVAYANAAYFQYMADFSLDAVKSLSCSMFFQNFIFVTDCTSHGVFGLAGCHLTKNQVDLLIWGKYFNSLIKNTAASIPEELYGDPDKLIEWTNSKSKQEAHERKRGSRAGGGNQSSFVFGDREEIKSLYGDISGDRVIQESKKKGGLDIFDLAK